MGQGTKWGEFRVFEGPCWDKIIGDASRKFSTRSALRIAEVVLGLFLCGLCVKTFCRWSFQKLLSRGLSHFGGGHAKVIFGRVRMSEEGTTTTRRARRVFLSCDDALGRVALAEM